MKRTLLSLVLILVFVDAFSQKSPIEDIGKKDMKIAEGLWVGEKAPRFEKETLAGNKIIFPKQKLTLIEFWGTWCKPCIEKLPFLQDVHEFYSGEHFEILGMANDNKFKVSKFIKTHSVDWDQVISTVLTNGEILETYRVKSFPTLYLIGNDDIIIAATKDLRTYSLYQNIAKYLNQDPQLFIDHIQEGDIMISVPNRNYISLLVNEGDLSERNKFLYEHKGSLVRGFMWPDDADKVIVTIEIEHHNYEKETKNITIDRDQIINGVFVLDLHKL